MGVHEAVGLDTGDNLQLVIDQTPCYQHIVNHIDGSIKVMCDLPHQGRMPAELPRVLAEPRAARQPRPRPQRPVPCGSGHKFKKCHASAKALAGD